MARQQLSVGNYKYRTDKIENNIKQEDKAGTVRETSDGTCRFLGSMSSFGVGFL